MKTVTEAARKVRKNAHAPYSQYKVGAAVETDDGTIISGSNVESSSYGLTTCAERVALGSAVAKGHRKFKSIAVVTQNGAAPCGACRQVIWDLCGDIRIVLVDEKGNETETTAGDLLPDPFDDRSIKK